MLPDAISIILFVGDVDRFELSLSELELIKDIYLPLVSSRKYKRLIVSRLFFEEFNLMAKRSSLVEPRQFSYLSYCLSISYLMCLLT